MKISISIPVNRRSFIAYPLPGEEQEVFVSGVTIHGTTIACDGKTPEEADSALLQAMKQIELIIE